MEKKAMPSAEDHASAQPAAVEAEEQRPARKRGRPRKVVMAKTTMTKEPTGAVAEGGGGGSQEPDGESKKPRVAADQPGAESSCPAAAPQGPGPEAAEEKPRIGRGRRRKGRPRKST